MCQRERCLACDQLDDRPLPGCAHDRLERHEKPHLAVDRSHTVRLDEGSEFLESARGGRTPTKPMLRLTGGSIDADFADADAAAEFLEMVARVLREKKKLRIIIE
jgi:hypothetical protein